MDIAAEISTAMPGLRRAAESLMTDVVRISRPGGTPDPLTGQPAVELVYEGPGKVQSFRPYERVADVVGAAVVVSRREVHVPADAGEFRVGDVVDVLESRTQPAVVGNTYRVAFPDEKTHQTAQRLLVDQ